MAWIMDQILQDVSTRGRAISQFLRGWLGPTLYSSAWVVGGALRSDKRRDIDVVLDTDVSVDWIKGQLGPSERTTAFGGLVYSYGGEHVDVWRLQDSWFYDDRTLKVGMHSYMARVHTDIQQIAYHASSGTIMDMGYSAARKSGLIELVYENNPYKREALNKALRIATDMKMLIGTKLFSSFIKEFVTGPSGVVLK